MSSSRQPNRTLDEPNRRRSSVHIEHSPRRHRIPDWALPQSNHDVASCSSDDDHERVELDDRKGYCSARRKKLRVRRRWARKIGPAAYEPRFCEELTEHVRSIEDGPLDADGIEKDEGFFATLTAPYEPPSPSQSPKIDWATYSSPSPVPLQKPNQNDSPVRRVGCPPGLCSCPAEQDVDNNRESDDDEPIPHLDEDYEMDNHLYTPSGKWETMRHSPIDGWETLMRIKGMV